MSKTTTASPLPAEHFETIAEAAARLGVHHKTLRRRIAEGQIKAYRFGPQLIRLARADVDAMLRPIPTVGNAA